MGVIYDPVLGKLRSDNNDELLNLIRSYTIDFQEERETVQMRNLNGNIKYTKIIADNVVEIRLSVGDNVHVISMDNGEWNGSISIPDGILIIWDISRKKEGAIASVNIKYQ